MSPEDDLIMGLEQLLDRVIPKDFGLDEWRHAYRRVLFTVAMRIFGSHPEIIVGPLHPSPAGNQPPYRPNIVAINCIVTGDCLPPPTPVPPEGTH